MSDRISKSLLYLLGMGILFTTGCSSRNLLDSSLLGDSFSSSIKDFQKKLFQKKKNRIPVRCDVRWEAAKGPKLNGQPGRGFRGWVNFFAPGSPEPVKVDGDVRIYVFDDQGTIEEQAKPIHQFDFNAVTWNAYLYKKEIGPTYGLFVPYTRPNNLEAKVSLMIRLKPKIGSVIYSDMVTIHLPGTKRKPRSRVTGLDAREFNLNRPKNVGTKVDSYRRQTGRQIENPLQQANSKKNPTRKITSELATKKLFQLLNERLKNDEFTKIEKRQTDQAPISENHPQQLLLENKPDTLPNQIAKSDSIQKPHKRFQLMPAPGTRVANPFSPQPVRSLPHPQVKTETPTPPLALPLQKNEWHSFEE